MHKLTLSLLDGVVETSRVLQRESIYQAALKRPEPMTYEQSQQKLFNILATVLIVTMVAVSTVGVGVIGMLVSVKETAAELADKLQVTPAMLSSQIDEMSGELSSLSSVIDQSVPIITNNSKHVTALEIRAETIEHLFLQAAKQREADQLVVMTAIKKLTTIAEDNNRELVGEAFSPPEIAQPGDNQ